MFIRFFNGDDATAIEHLPFYGDSESFAVFGNQLLMKKDGVRYVLAERSDHKWRIVQADHGGELYDYFGFVDDVSSSNSSSNPYWEPPKDKWALIRRTVAPNEHYLVGVFNSADDAKGYVDSFYPPSHDQRIDLVRWKECFLELGWKIELGSTMGYWIIPCRQSKSWGWGIEDGLD